MWTHLESRIDIISDTTSSYRSETQFHMALHGDVQIDTAFSLGCWHTEKLFRGCSTLDMYYCWHGPMDLAYSLRMENWEMKRQVLVRNQCQQAILVLRGIEIYLQDAGRNSPTGQFLSIMEYFWWLGYVSFWTCRLMKPCSCWSFCSLRSGPPKWLVLHHVIYCSVLLG